uniref:Uncharacterized protein n=1 Tax=Ascaris lumbricoides TaxID=6252 RepID=A0A0M3I810_ASCLU
MSISTFFLVGSFSLIAQCCRRKGKKTESSDDANVNKTTTTPSYSPILTKFQSEGTPKSLPIAPSKSQSPEVLKTQTSKRIEEDGKTDSFAHHTPRIRVSKRTSEIRSKPPVCGDRDDYKTIPLQMFPSSSDDGD